MVETRVRSALVETMITGRLGKADPEGDPGVIISEVRERTLVHMAGNADYLARATAISLPTSAGRVATDGGTRVLWLGPDRWLLIGPTAPFGEWERRLAGAAPHGGFNEVTFGRTTLRLRGPRIREVLAKGCPLDLDAGVFSAGRCAESLLGHLNVLLECRAVSTFEVTVTRSYGADLLGWLKRAAAEYGFEISA